MICHNALEHVISLDLNVLNLLDMNNFDTPLRETKRFNGSTKGCYR